uniref:Prolyl 4-hydroxylase alpha subunit Fe(2+) 2OG dioxygenase domain-containing protein n=1 Tax=Coccolithus braarudii TaxID=221442 RepID=A0A7S0Q535_9EUKA|mmetsp:Transcript_36247/g.77312  ORF Transcript_36247/g.77312 Transcript_36247/m.77312 type:complete len:271 (+) Transcript_36247:32-844(+)|eukprot:CAMPEP_0183361882 /NCGR_PEP_ID=MMETSP0164_2-20130417/64777_1 /TAXON_ID=221442 /ORGANISM="Coccolithus pelagicus ssp braarudi, Strain PLY182g" /LENGTH=270 /DNA_ID=CAMNT_0025536591 /DNA_START=1 /DNA_END=813 /DNA_ORIENTATION=-
MKWLLLFSLGRGCLAFGRLTPGMSPSSDRGWDGSILRLQRNDQNLSLVQWLQCAHAPQDELHSLTNGRRKAWREPVIVDRCCFPANCRCFRAVYDGRVRMLEPVSSNREKIAHYTREIAEVLATEFGVRDLKSNSARSRTFTEADATRSRREQQGNVGALNYTELHADYYESASYIFTGVLFLGEEAADEIPLVGGELGFVDACMKIGDNMTVPTQGVVIEPLRGRLVLFTGGGENYHSPMPVVRGRRTTFHVWFRCSCESSMYDHYDAP